MGYLGLKRAVGRAAAIFPRSRHRSQILLYHGVGGAPRAVATESFSEQIRYMYDQGIICSLDDLLKNRSTDASRFTVTFDDGFESVMLNAVPVLQARKLPAIIYVSTKTIDTQKNVPSEVFRCFAPGERLLSWHQLRSLRLDGFEVGSHFADHASAASLSASELIRQLEESRATIENECGECRHLAYPWGIHDERSKRLAEAAGYSTAVGAIHGPIAACTDLFALPRICITGDLRLDDFRNILDGRWDYLTYVQRLRRVYATPQLLREPVETYNPENAGMNHTIVSTDVGTGVGGGGASVAANDAVGSGDERRD